MFKIILVGAYQRWIMVDNLIISPCLNKLHQPTVDARLSNTNTLALFTACTGHASILNYRFVERANLRAFIQLPALLLVIFTHLHCFIHALKCPLIICKLGFVKLFTTNFIPYGRWTRVAFNTGIGLCGDVLKSSTRWRKNLAFVPYFDIFNLHEVEEMLD